jgi:hypothetical protein
MNNILKRRRRSIGAVDPWSNTKSIIFDGSDDIIHLDSTTLAGPGSFQFWIKTSSSTNQMILSVTAYHYLFLVGSGKVRCTWPSGWGNSHSDMTWTIDPASEFADGEWHHLVMTNDRSGIIGTTGETKIYWDGDLKATRSGTGRADLGGEADVVSYIGGQASGTLDFNGNIDEVAFWEGVTLDADAITVLYNSGAPINLAADSGNYDNSGDLTNWWRMGDGDTYPTITDNKGSIDGTMTNMAADDIVTDTP